MRLAALLVVLLAGCRPTIDYPDVYADLACEAAYSVLRDRAEVHPSPKPPASDQCENCAGTGIIGDGRVKITCPECKGTGKKLKSVIVCPDGKCKP